VGTLGSRGLGVPVVGARRNLGKGYWHTSSELRLQRFLNRFTAAWVANSEAVRRYTLEAEGVPPERMAVIPNALDLGRFHPLSAGVDRREARRRLGLPDGLLLICVANLRPVKGVDLALEAFASIAGSIPEAHLLLVGEGEEHAPLRARAESLGLDRRVHFLGSREDVPELLRVADVGVLASRGEGSSNAVLEYAACGLPVVATAVGGTPEWMEASQGGRLVPGGDVNALSAAMAELAGDPALRSGLGAAGRAYVERHHGVEPVLAAWIEFLTTVAARG
jgi:glycosyltransferase involved in cell wall biosynthesis